MNESVRSEAEKFAGAKALNCCEPDRRPEGLLHPAFHRFVARARQGAKARSIETLYAAMNGRSFTAAAGFLQALSKHDLKRAHALSLHQTGCKRYRFS